MSKANQLRGIRENLKDNDILDWGKEHRGKALVNVPASYLIWMYTKATNVPLQYTKYIKENLDVIEREAAKERKSIR